MKKIFLISLILGVLSACDKNENSVNEPDNELLGNWELIEVLVDPGDGSGTFNTVQSNKTLIFENDGVITSNGNLCDMSVDSDNATSGTYSVTDMTFSSSDCSNPDYDFTFEKNGNILIINYPCIEPCKVKYEKK